jgi:hypothetical protein
MPYRVGASPSCSGVKYYLNTQGRFRLASFAFGASVDWNNDCGPIPATVASDVNDFSVDNATMEFRVYNGLGLTTLSGHHDWANLIYDFKTSPTHAPGAPAEPIDCSYDDAVRLFLSSIRRECPADFNGSGTVSVQDIFDYISDWSSQSTGGPILIASADFNGTGGVTVQDLFDFITAWNAGCP